jgi:RND family efflux transporter MFP subunit
MTNTKTNKSIIQKTLIPVLALVIILLMVAWLAGSFNEKVSPGLNEDTNQKTSTKKDSKEDSKEDSKTNDVIIDKNNSYILVASKETILEPVAATLEARQATIISARILARIKQIYYRAGDLVKKGDVLIQLEQDDLQSQMLQAKQNITAMLSRNKEAKKNLDRTTELFRKKLISEFELDKSRTNYQTIHAQLISAEQAFTQAETTLSYATLVAPINGRIVDRFAEPGDTAQPGIKLLSLYNPLSLRVEAQVREQLALTLTNGQNIEIELPNVNNTIMGKIEEIVPAANTGARSFLVKVRITYSEKLLPGMYARMLIPAGSEKKLMLPKENVAHVGQLNFVWVNVNGDIQRRFVRLGKEQNGMVAVISGLVAGDEIITL